MIQTALFDLLESPKPPETEPLPPHNGTETSRAAAESMRDHVSRLRQMVLDAIGAAGDRGLTCQEAEAATGLAHETCSPRILEIERIGLVRKARDAEGAVVKRPTLSGRKAAVYVAVTMEP